MSDDLKEIQLELEKTLKKTQLEKYNLALPKVLDLNGAKNMKALFDGISEIDVKVSQYIKSVSDGQSLELAKGDDLSIHGQNLGIAKSNNMDISDVAFKELIKKIAFQKKMVIRAFYDLAKIFYDKKYIYAHVKLTWTDVDALVADLKTIKVDGELLNISAGITEDDINNIDPDVVYKTGGFVYVYSRIPGLTGSVTKGQDDPETILTKDKRFCIYDYGLGNIQIEYPVDIAVIQKKRKGSGYISHGDALSETKILINGNLESVKIKYNHEVLSDGTYIFELDTFFDQFIGVSDSGVDTGGVIISDLKITLPTDFTVKIRPNGKALINMNPKYEVSYVYDETARTVTLASKPADITIRNLSFISARTKFNITGADYGTYITSIEEGTKDIKEYFERIKAAGVIIKETFQN